MQWIMFVIQKKKFKLINTSNGKEGIWDIGSLHYIMILDLVKWGLFFGFQNKTNRRKYTSRLLSLNNTTMVNTKTMSRGLIRNNNKSNSIGDLKENNNKEIKENNNQRTKQNNNNKNGDRHNNCSKPGITSLSISTISKKKLETDQPAAVLFSEISTNKSQRHLTLPHPRCWERWKLLVSFVSCSQSILGKERGLLHATKEKLGWQNQEKTKIYITIQPWEKRLSRKS